MTNTKSKIFPLRVGSLTSWNRKLCIISDKKVALGESTEAQSEFQSNSVGPLWTCVFQSNSVGPMWIWMGMDNAVAANKLDVKG